MSDDLLDLLDEIANTNPTYVVRVGDIRRTAKRAAEEIRFLYRKLEVIGEALLAETIDDFDDYEDDDQ